MQAIDKEILAHMNEAYKQVKSDPEPDLAELVYDVYAKSVEANVRGVTYYQSMPHKNIGTAINLK